MSTIEAELARRRVSANEARQVLDNHHFKEAFAAVADYIEAQAMACDPNQTERAARIILAKQLLEKVRRELVRKMEDGDMAEVQIAEIERKRGLLRFVR